MQGYKILGDKYGLADGLEPVFTDYYKVTFTGIEYDIFLLGLSMLPASPIVSRLIDDALKLHGKGEVNGKRI